MSMRLKTVVLHYIAPCLAVGGVVGLEYLMSAYIGLVIPYFITQPFSLIIALVFGLWPGVATALAGGVFTEIFIIKIAGRFDLYPGYVDDALRILLTTVFAGAVGYLVDKLRTARSNAENWAKILSPLKTILPLTDEDFYDLARSKAERIRLLEEVEDLYQHAPCGYHSLDAAGAFIRINDTALKWLGYTRDEIVGRRTMLDLIPPEGRSYFWENFATLKAHGEVTDRKFTLIRQDGSTFPVLLNASAVRDAAGRFTMSRSIIFDMSALEELEKEKEKVRTLSLEKEKVELSSKAKAEFVAKVSHEIRTPMNAIMGMTDLALMTGLTETQRSYLNFVKSGAGRLLALVNDMVDFSKIESGRMELAQTPFSIADVIREKGPAYRAVIGDKPVVFECASGEDLPPLVYGDSLRLHQILDNLIGNAIKFTERGIISLVVRVAHRSKGCVTLAFAVSDTGPGIPADKRERLFKYFSQIDASIQQIYGGAGLGLFIVKELVEMMGGTVGVDSEPGKGSTFHFTAQFGLPEAEDSIS